MLKKNPSISEISTPSDRGMLMSGYQVVIQGCALIGFWGAYASNAAIPDTSDLQWQIPVSVQLVPGIILLFGAFFIKETPHYLAATSSIVEVESTLSWFRGLPTTDPAITREAKEISTTVLAGSRRQEIRKTSFIREAFSKPIRKRLSVGVGLFVTQNMSGMNALNYYVPVIFMTAGFKTVSESLFLTGIFGAVKLVSAALFMFVCVRIYGNRFWLIWGTTVCAVSMAVLGYCVATMPRSSDPMESTSLSARAIISVLCVYIYAMAFGVSMGPIAWNVCSEIFPNYINAQCCAVTTCTQWLFQIIIAAITPILLNAIGPMTFVFYSVCNVVGLVFYYTSVPETRGVALGRDMAKVFGVDAKDEEEFGQVEVEEVEDVDEITPLLVADRRRRRSSIAIVV
jgi:sugar porter (SP) family MFS transporter